jgi:hypothetical protein
MMALIVFIGWLIAALERFPNPATALLAGALRFAEAADPFFTDGLAVFLRPAELAGAGAWVSAEVSDLVGALSDVIGLPSDFFGVPPVWQAIR